jgi:trigger factor
LAFAPLHVLSGKTSGLRASTNLSRRIKATPLTSTDLTSSDSTPEVIKNPCEREVSVEVPAEEVSRAWKSTLARFQKHARVPGFRNGKVPATIIRSKFADEIKSEIVEHLLPSAFREETKKQNLVPIGQPRVVELELEEEKPLRFKAIFEVLPPFDVTGYKEIKIKRQTVEVNDEEVQKMITNLLDQNSTYINVDEDRGIADGDYASVAFKSTSLEEGAEPVEMNDVLVDIGGANTLPEFSTNLRGAKAGEFKSFDVTYAEDFGDKRLAGKTLHYDVEVKGIKTKSVPELSDEWVKELGQENLNTLEDLRTRIRESIEHEKKHQAEHKEREEVLQQLTEKFPIDVPTHLVENSIDQRLERGLRSLVSHGLRAEDLKRMDLSKLRDGQREGAMRDVRANVLLEKIADLEDIQITDEDVDKQVSEAAQQSHQNPLTLRKQLEENNGLAGLRQQMRCDRALDLLYKQSE